MFDPENWYWLADDGRVYSSSRQATVKKTDATYKAWASAGRVPTRWPEDDAGEQTDAALQAVLAPYGLGTVVPAISPRQLRLWLLGKGLLDKVDTAIGALPEPDRSAVQIEWEYATIYERDNPFVVKLGAALKMTPEEIDEGFREAAQL